MQIVPLSFNLNKTKAIDSSLTMESQTTGKFARAMNTIATILGNSIHSTLIRASHWSVVTQLSVN